jgi:hypothetical protein
MLNGKYDIDVEELRPYVIFQGNLDEQHETILWLWQAMREMEIDSRRSLLMFFTGSTRIPLDGFDPPLNITEGVDMEVVSLKIYYYLHYIVTQTNVNHDSIHQQTTLFP